MAIALRQHRSEPARLVRSTQPVRPSVPPRPQLRVVPTYRRRTAGVLAALIVAHAGVMLGAVMLHTRLAERQLEIDRLDAAATAARERFDDLRRERAELRSPARLAAEAARLGMAPGDSSTFVEVDPYVVAQVLAAAGDYADVAELTLDDPLEQYQRVKQVTGVTP
jgi:hypothetical protein